MSTASREVRIDLRPDPGAFMALLGVAVLLWLTWYWLTDPGLAPVIVSLGVLLALALLRGPLTRRRAVIVGPSGLTVASRRLIQRQTRYAAEEVEALREQQVGLAKNSVYELELVLRGGKVRKLGELAPGFRPKLRGAQSLLRRVRA